MLLWNPIYLEVVIILQRRGTVPPFKYCHTIDFQNGGTQKFCQRTSIHNKIQIKIEMLKVSEKNVTEMSIKKIEAENGDAMKSADKRTIEFVMFFKLCY